MAYLLEKKPEERPPSAGEARAAILRVRAGKPLDDREVQMESTLASFRESIATPTTPVSDADDTPAVDNSRGLSLSSRVRRQWTRLSLWTQLAAVAVVLALAGVAAVASLPQTVDNMPDQGSISLWFQPPEVATFRNETPTVAIASIHLPDFAVATAAWPLDSPMAIIQLDGFDHSARHGQRTVCGLYPSSQDATVNGPPLRSSQAPVSELQSHALAGADGQPNETGLTVAHVSPDGSSVAYGRKTGRTRYELYVARSDDGTVTAELGEGWMCAWHPSGNYLVATAPDRKGQYQLWAVEARPPHHRVQLTCLDGGVSQRCAASDDGRWAMAALESTELPAMCFADLRNIAFPPGRTE